MYFNYTGTNDTYDNIETYMFSLDKNFMENETAVTSNANYNIKISGTTNMTSILRGQSFAAKGHYYQLSSAAADSKPQLFDSDMQEILPVEANDDTYIGVERYSGRTLLTLESVFYNM